MPRRAIVAAFIISMSNVLTVVWADDAPIKNVGGMLAPLDEDGTPVQMIEEDVTIILDPKSYECDASFIFRNDGPKIIEKVGFPNFSMGYKDDFHTPNYVSDMDAWIDGVKVELSKESGWLAVGESIDHLKLLEKYDSDILRKSDSGTLYAAVDWLTKVVAFDANDTCKTRVRYRSDYTVSEVMTASYFFGSGKYWAGPISKARFRVIQEGATRLNCLPRFGSSSDEFRGTAWRNSEGTVVCFEVNDLEPSFMDRVDFLAADHSTPFEFQGEFEYRDSEIPDSTFMIARCDDILALEKLLSAIISNAEAEKPSEKQLVIAKRNLQKTKEWQTRIENAKRWSDSIVWQVPNP